MIKKFQQEAEEDGAMVEVDIEVEDDAVTEVSFF